MSPRGDEEGVVGEECDVLDGAAVVERHEGGAPVVALSGVPDFDGVIVGAGDEDVVRQAGHAPGADVVAGGTVRKYRKLLEPSLRGD